MYNHGVCRRRRPTTPDTNLNKIVNVHIGKRNLEPTHTSIN
jgi:hypothetical protein